MTNLWNEECKSFSKCGTESYKRFVEASVRHLTSMLKEDMTTAEIHLGQMLVDMGLCRWQQEDENHYESLERA